MAIHLYYDKKELDLANCTEFLFALLQFVSVMIIFMKFFDLYACNNLLSQASSEQARSECNEELPCEH